MANFFLHTFRYSLLLIAPLAYATSPETSLFKRGDSLFRAGNYLEAYTIYETLHSQGHTTQTQLLRMAYIQEGLKSYPKALAHLVDYYAQTSHTEVWHKILALSKALKVEKSYEHTSLPFLAWLLSYEWKIVFLLGGSSLFLIGYALRRTPGSVLLGSIVVVTGMMIGFLHKDQWLPKYVIVIEEGAHLRKSPSAASPHISDFALTQGTLCKVVHVGPVWTRLHTAQQEGYVRTQKLMPTAQFM